MSPDLAVPDLAIRQNDIEYSVNAGTRLFMDASIPQGEGRFPAVIVVHGGGWVRGDRRIDVAPLFPPLEQAGIAWFSIDYRLASDVMQFGNAVEDVRSAIAFVKGRAARFRIDPDRIALVGESAGGQLAAMAALNPTQITRTRAVVALYTPMDLVTLANSSNFIPQQIRSSLRGSPFEKIVMGRLRQLSPVENIRPGAPPFLLIHGTSDQLVPFSQSRTMCERVKAAGSVCDLYAVEGGGHGIRGWESAHPREAAAYKAKMALWLKGHFA